MAPSHRATDRKLEEIGAACLTGDDSGRRAEVHDVHFLALGFGGLSGWFGLLEVVCIDMERRS